MSQENKDKYNSIKPGQVVRVHQKIKELNAKGEEKERIQIFEGLVLRVTRRGSLSSAFTVRRVASGVGVEKTYLIHSPNILKIEVVKRTKVRRNYLTYMRELTGKSARLAGVDFDREAVNVVHDEAAEVEEAKIHEESLAKHDELAAKEAQERAKEEAKAEAALAKHQAKAEAEQVEGQPAEKADAKAPAEEQNKEK